MADFGYNISGRKVWLWADEDNGYRRYKVSLSNKTKDGDTEYMSVEIQLPKTAPDYPNKTLVNFDGFPTFRTYIDKSGKKNYIPRIVATRVWADGENTPTYNDPDKFDSYEELSEKVNDAFGDMLDISFESTEDDIPF